MSSLGYVDAFRRYKAELANPQWAVSAISANGELVISCWSHLFGKNEDGELPYRDRVGRFSGNVPGANLLKEHLQKALTEQLPVRLIIATTEHTDVVDRGGNASEAPKTFRLREDLIGYVKSFDGDSFELRFRRPSDPNPRRA